MRPKRISLAAIDTYVVPVSQYDKGYRIQVGGTFVGTYSVEFTSADIHKLGAAAAIWKSETEQTAKTGGTGLHYGGAITAFRLNVTAYTSGNVEMNITGGSKRFLKKEFRFTIKTTAPNETFTPPFEITGTYDCNIRWGDGNSNHITVWNHADVTHSYATPGTHEIAITGTIIGWRFNNAGDCAKYYETKSWGPLRLGNNDGYFYGCVNHTCTATDVLDLMGTTTFENGFRGNTSLIEIPSINSWDFSLVTNCNSFLNGSNLYNQELIMNPSSFGYILSMFRDAFSFDQNMGGWDIGALLNASNFLINVTLSVANYDALILGWGPQAQTIVANFHGGNSKYTGGGAVEAARDAWIAKGWIITDGGIAP